MIILNVGTVALSDTDKQITYLSKDSLLDGDITLINTNIFHSELRTEYKKRNSSSDSFDNIKIHLLQREYDLEEFFNSGRTLVVELGEYETEKYETYVKHFHNISFFDHLKLKIKLNLSPMRGDNVEYNSNINHLDTKENKSVSFSYNFSIDSDTGIPLLKIRNTNHIISQAFKIGNGLLIILPPPKLIGSKPEFSNKGYSKLVKELVKECRHQINNNDQHVIEEWANSLSMKFEEPIINKKELLNQEILKVEALKTEFQNLEKVNFKIKQVIASTGNALEYACSSILTTLGFKLNELKVQNRTDISAKFNDYNFVFEIKGIKGTSAEKHAAQLQKWVSDYHISKDINPKGVLLVNSFRSIPVYERDVITFPDQMLDYSKKMEHCLMTTAQLLSLYFDFEEGNIDINEEVEKIFNTNGKCEYKISNKLERTYIQRD